MSASLGGGLSRRLARTQGRNRAHGGHRANRDRHRLCDRSGLSRLGLLSSTATNGFFASGQTFTRRSRRSAQRRELRGQNGWQHRRATAAADASLERCDPL
jgi:hypothetical protein